MTNILEKIALGWLKSEMDFLKDIPYSMDFFEFNLIGNKRTHYQVQEWISPKDLEIQEKFKNWDGKSPLNFEISNDGKGYIASFSKAFKKEKIPKKLPEIGHLKLYNSSKVTDFILSDFLENSGMFVSKRAKQILEKYNVGKFKFYPAEIEHKNIRYKDYFFFRCDNNVDQFIDITNSTFYYQKPSFGAEGRTKITFKNETEILDFLKRNEGKQYNDCEFVYSEQIVFRTNFPEADFFFLKKFMYGRSKPFISKRLMEALNECSGIEFEPTKAIK